MRRSFIIIAIIALIAVSNPLKREQAQTDPKSGFKTHKEISQAGQTGSEGQTNQNRQQSDSLSRPGSQALPSDAFADGFIITRTEHGTLCRQMTIGEARELGYDRERTGLSVIGPANRDNQLLQQQTQQGLKIILRASSQLDSFPDAKAAFIRAAATWESIIQSPITMVIDVDYGPTRFGVPYPSPNIIGSTDTQTVGANGIYSAVRTQLILGAGNDQQSSIFGVLPFGTVPTDSGNTSYIFNPATLFRALDFLPPVADPDGELANLGPPPAIGFNSSILFDFDPGNGIDDDKIDFTGAAVHEIGHALGFASLVGTRERLPTFPVSMTTWDLFRFRPGVNLQTFSNTQRILLSAGEHIHFAGGGELGLSTARDDGVGGDGRQASHWKDDIFTGQYIGVMDPSGVEGERDEITANDLLTLGHFGYQVKSDVMVTEILSIDDGSRNLTPVVPGALVVNRLTPARYPATVRGVRINIPSVSGQPSPVGAPVRVVIFNDPARTGQPPNNPQLLFDQTFTVPRVTFNGFLEFDFNGPTINAGDVYLGVQGTTTPLGIAIDTDGSQPTRSFISQNNGANFQPLVNIVQGASRANYMARALVSEPFGSVPIPDLAAVSPNAVAPGGQSFNLYVQGNNFLPASVVRWNGADRQTTLLTGSLLQAVIPASDITTSGTAGVTVFTPGTGGGSSTTLTVSITSDNPAPVLTGLTPGVAASGGQSTNVRVFGRNFTSASMARFNGNNRVTGFVSSVQLTITLTNADVSTAGAGAISVSTPGPGGGVSNDLPFNVITCAYSTNFTTRSFRSTGGNDGVTLTTNSVCGWTASADVPWISVTSPAAASGTGKFVVNYRVDPNPTANLRSGKLTVGGQTINISQAGVLANVSAANYAAPLAPESITAAFGAGMARSTLNATTTPLPTTLDGTSVRVTDSNGTARAAPLFFVSSGQINYLVPTGTATGTALVEVVIDNAMLVSSGTVQIVAVAPGLFSANANGKDVAAAVVLRIKDGVQTFEPATMFDQAQARFIPRPIDLGPETDKVYVLLFSTGVRGRGALSGVSIKIGDVDTPPEFAGPQGELFGVDQINVLLPRTLKGRGQVNVVMTVEGKSANLVTLAFQ